MANYYVKQVRTRWYVTEETWVNGKRKRRTIPKQTYFSMGINPEWTVDQVRERLAQLASEKRLVQSQVTAARNAAHAQTIKSVYLPEDDVKEFTERLIEKSFGSPLHTKKLLSHLRFIETMSAHLKIDPRKYYDQGFKVFKYFLEKKCSLDYSSKLLRILNEWGYFICMKRGQFFRPISRPRGQVQQAIVNAYTTSGHARLASLPLTPDLLESKKLSLDIANYKWLFISVWFGLRPGEIDQIKDPQNLRVGMYLQKPFIDVYQSKLTAIAEEDRWKQIPILYPEQQQALHYIREGLYKKPTHKTMRKVFGKGVQLYAGRKNFEDLMHSKGHPLEDIASWLGHQNINTTWKRYRKRRRLG